MSLRKITQLESSQISSDAKSLHFTLVRLGFLSFRELPTFSRSFFSNTSSLCLNSSGDQELTTHQLLVKSSNFWSF